MRLSEALEQFIVRHIHSIDQLEMLLMMQKEPFREWSVDEVARLLFTPPESVLLRLEQLAGGGLIQSKSGGQGTTYRYSPQNADLEGVVAELAAAYPTYRVTIINLIFSKPIDRIRTFADAFRLKKDDESKK